MFLDNKKGTFLRNLFKHNFLPKYTPKRIKLQHFNSVRLTIQNFRKIRKKRYIHVHCIEIIYSISFVILGIFLVYPLYAINVSYLVALLLQQYNLLLRVTVNPFVTVQHPFQNTLKQQTCTL